MWTPDLRLQASPGFSALILGLHGLAATALWWMEGSWRGAVPLVLVCGIYLVWRHGLKQLPASTRRLWLTPEGWWLQSRDGRESGPWLLGPSSRIDIRFVRLGFYPARGGILGRLLRTRHLILTPAMTGADDFRRLQVFLRWSPEKNQVPERAT